MKKTRYLAVLPLTAGAVMAFAAIGPAAAKDSYTIGVSNTVQGNGWREEMICAIKAQAIASGKVSKLNIAHRNTDAAGRMGIPVVNTFCGGDAAKHVDANWKEALTVWPDIIAHARDNGVKLAFENCPMIFSYDEWPGGHNIAYSPYTWRRIFDTWGNDIGLNFDPSHLVWQMIDQARFIREFGARIVHVHAKDLMIDRDGHWANVLADAVLRSNRERNWVEV